MKLLYHPCFYYATCVYKSTSSRQLQLTLHMLSNGIDVPSFLAVHPVGHEVIAIRLMRGGDEHLQSREELLPHRPGGSSKQDMRSKLRKVGIHILVSGSLRHHAPENLVDAIVQALLIDDVAVLLEATLQHSLDDGVRLGIFRPASAAMMAIWTWAGVAGVTGCADTLFRQTCTLKNFRYCLKPRRSAGVCDQMTIRRL